MCVIMAAKSAAIPPDMLAKGFEANPHGAGIAWRDSGYVRWIKGLDLDDTIKLAEKLPPPYVVHFRIPSGGQADIPALNHPFPVDKHVSLDLEGKTKGYVLFHNGHWTSWQHEVKDAALKKGIPIPVGKWSDTRAMAFLAYIYGLGILEFINEKSLVFGPVEAQIFGGPWSPVKVGGHEIWCSNSGWQSKPGKWYGCTYEKRTTLALPEKKSLPSPSSNNGQGTTVLPGVGGDPTESPFEKAHRELKDAQALFLQNTPEQKFMSRNKLKKFQRAVDQEARKEMIRTRSSQLADPRMTTLH